jgi:arylsulfatase A-like enzyme
MRPPRLHRVLRPGTAALLLLTSLPAQAEQRLSSSRPNIVFLFSDDHAAHAISAYGSRINRTPNIDRLAADGVLFRNNFCGNSICGPSRATILTGLHCHAHGFMRNGNLFDGTQTTFPKLLQQAGYTTAIIGKWHLTSDPTGFDHWMVLPGQGDYYNPDFLTPQGRQRLQGHATNLTTELAIDWLENGRDPDKPFVLMCQHKAPHRTWMPAPEDLALYRDETIPEPATLFDDYQGRTEATRHHEMEIDRHMYLFYDLKLVPDADQQKDLKGPDRWWQGMLDRMDEGQRAGWDAAFRAENLAFRENPPTGKNLVRWKYQRYIKNYLRCVAGVDRSVGKLLDWLDEHPDVKQNTIVVYSSDQGFYLGDHGWYDKRWMYEESFRMPLVVSWPGHIQGGSEATELTQNIDFAPTFLDLAGVPVPASMHGQSLLPVLEGRVAKGEVAWRDALYYHYYESHAVHMVPAHYGVRTDRYKLIRYYEPQWDAWELYDLQNDPDELHNLADDPAHQEVRRQLTERLQQLRERYDDRTGVLGDGAFPYTAGIASAVGDTDGGWRVWSNTSGGYLLADMPQQPEAPATVTLSTSMLPVDGRQQQNGYILLTAGEPRQQLVRAGVAFGRGRLHVIGPQGMKEQVGTAIEWDGKSPVKVTVTVDFTAKQARVEALGQQVTATLPESFRRLSAVGYGTSHAETLFGPLLVQ